MLTVMASDRVWTEIRLGTDRHFSVPWSGRSGFGSVWSIPWLLHRSVPIRCRSMLVLDHGHTQSGRSNLSQISEKSQSGWSGSSNIRSIPRLPHRSVLKSSRSMSVLDHSQTGSVGSAWAKYSRNLGRVQEPVRTDRDFIMWMSWAGSCNREVVY